MNYKVGIVLQNDFFDTHYGISYYDDTKKWAFTLAQLETYKMYKSPDEFGDISGDQRDMIKWQRMEQQFRKQYDLDSKILLEYES